MIGVAVRVDDRVDARHLVGERLRSKIGRRIDEHRGPSAVLMRIDARDRLSRGSVDVQVPHSQPIIGTPCDVPVPSTSTLAAALKA